MKAQVIKIDERTSYLLLPGEKMPDFSKKETPKKKEVKGK